MRYQKIHQTRLVHRNSGKRSHVLLSSSRCECVHGDDESFLEADVENKPMKKKKKSQSRRDCLTPRAATLSSMQLLLASKNRGASGSHREQKTQPRLFDNQPQHPSSLRYQALIIADVYVLLYRKNPPLFFFSLFVAASVMVSIILAAVGKLGVAYFTVLV